MFMFILPKSVNIVGKFFSVRLCGVVVLSNCFCFFWLLLQELDFGHELFNLFVKIIVLSLQFSLVGFKSINLSLESGWVLLSWLLFNLSIATLKFVEETLFLSKCFALDLSGLQLHIVVLEVFTTTPFGEATSRLIALERRVQVILELTGLVLETERNIVKLVCIVDAYTSLNFVVGNISAPLGNKGEGLGCFRGLVSIEVGQVLWVIAIVLVVFNLGFTSSRDVKKFML